MAKKDFKKFTGKVISPTGKKTESPIAKKPEKHAEATETSQESLQRVELELTNQAQEEESQKARKTESPKTEGLNFKVTPEFKIEFKIEAARNGLKMNEYLERIYYFFKENSQKGN